MGHDVDNIVTLLQMGHDLHYTGTVVSMGYEVHITGRFVQMGHNVYNTGEFVWKCYDVHNTDVWWHYLLNIDLDIKTSNKKPIFNKYLIINNQLKRA